MAVKLLQVNLNHSRRAQDLFCYALERGIGLGIVAEPYRVPDKNPNWAGDDDGSVVRNTAFRSPPLTVKERGRGYVAVEWGSTTYIACYAPPPDGASSNSPTAWSG